MDIKQVVEHCFWYYLYPNWIAISTNQIEDGEDFRVLISPLPPKVVEEVKEEKKVVKKKNDNRSAE